MKKLLQEFKEFALRGNVMDLAVGVIIGGAFSKIVTSLVNDILMPALGAVTGGASFSDYKLVIHPAVLDEAQNVITPESAILYGSFIQNIVDLIEEQATAHINDKSNLICLFTMFYQFDNLWYQRRWHIINGEVSNILKGLNCYSLTCTTHPCYNN